MYFSIRLQQGEKNCSITFNLMFGNFLPVIKMIFCASERTTSKGRVISLFFKLFFKFFQPVLEDEPIVKNGNGVHMNGDLFKYTNGHTNGHLINNNNGMVNGNGLKSMKE